MAEPHVLAVLATLLAGVVRTSVGVGSGIALTAALSLLFPPKLTLAIMAFVQIALGVSAITHYWGKWDQQLVVRLVGWMFAGVVVGTWMISIVPADVGRRVLGVALAIVAAIELMRRQPGGRSLLERSPAWLSGFMAGVAGSTANACGAVAGTYLKARLPAHEVFLSSLSIVVLLHDLFRLAVFWHFDLLSMEALRIAALLLPFAFIGGWLGTKVRAATSEPALRVAVFGLVFVVGVMLLR